MKFTIKEIKNDLRIPLSMLCVSFLKKLPYKGSYKGKRFMFKKESGKQLKVYLWKDLFCFENTDLAEIKEFCVEFSSDGIEKGLTFIAENDV